MQQHQFTITGGGSVLHHENGSLDFTSGTRAITVPAEDLPAFREWLNGLIKSDDKEIPSLVEKEAGMSGQPSSATTAGAEEIEPPRPPAGFELRGTPLPLLTRRDERWIARAFCDEGDGVLIYEEDREIIFLVSDEALTALYCLALESWNLLPHCTPELSAHRTQVIACLRSLSTRPPDRSTTSAR